MSATEKLYALVKAEPSDEIYQPNLMPGQGHDRAVWHHIVESAKRNDVSLASMRTAFRHWQQSNTPFDKNHPFHEDNAEFGTATGRYPFSYVPWKRDEELEYYVAPEAHRASTAYEWRERVERWMNILAHEDRVVDLATGEVRKIKWGENVPMWKKIEQLDLPQTRSLPWKVRIELAKMYNRKMREHRETPEGKQELERIKDDPELLEDYLRNIAKHTWAYKDLWTDEARLGVLRRRAGKQEEQQGIPYGDSLSDEPNWYPAQSGIPFTPTNTPVTQGDIEEERRKLMVEHEEWNLSPQARKMQHRRDSSGFVVPTFGRVPSSKPQDYEYPEGTAPTPDRTSSIQERIATGKLQRHGSFFPPFKEEKPPTPRKLSPTPTPQATSEVITDGEKYEERKFDPQEATRRIREANQGGGTPAGGRPVINEPPQNSPSQIIKPDSESTIKDKPVTKKPPSDEEEGTQLPLDLLLKFVTA